MSSFRLSFLVVALGLSLTVAGCRCDNRLVDTYQADAGEPEEVAVPPEVSPEVPPKTACAVGSVSGRVCAPDKQTWVGGAQVTLDGPDCNGEAYHSEAASQPDGSFELSNIPAGHWTVHATLGAFSQDYPVDVLAGQSAKIPDDQLCVAQKTTKIAVVTGAGDRIEQLLGGLNLQYDTFPGDAANWSASAVPFLSDLTRLKAYDLVFIDCAAAKTSGSSTIDLGPKSAQIKTALHDYVLQGGSLYASDWALLFPALAFPGKFAFKLTSGTVANPLDARKLQGYAPQTVTAGVASAALAAFLGKQTVEIAFPHQSGVNSAHWGVFTSPDPTTEVLIQAPQVTLCSASDTSCATSGANLNQVPLAVHIKLTAAGTRGGNVVYTSFHNIAQPTNDVSQVLKYIVLHL